MQLDFSTALTSDSFLLGQQYDSSMSQVISYPASEEIKFGQPVTIDFDKGTVANMTGTSSSNTNFHGIALRTNYQNAGSDISTAPPTTVTNTVGSYPKGAMVSIMKSGRVVVGFDNTAISGTPATLQTTGGSLAWVCVSLPVAAVSGVNLNRIALTSVDTTSTKDPFYVGATTKGRGVVIGYTVGPAVNGLVPLQIADADTNSPLTTLA
jgi:hypothetical protein